MFLCSEHGQLVLFSVGEKKGHLFGSVTGARFILIPQMESEDLEF